MISQIKPLRIKYFLPFNFEISTICVTIRLAEDGICKVITLSKSLESVKQLAAWQLLLIIYKKTDEWYIEWQSVTMSDNEWQWVVVSVNFLSFFFERNLLIGTLKRNTHNFKNLQRYYDINITHNLIVSSVGSGHPDQYSYEIPYEYLSGWENLSDKIISPKRKHYFLYRICNNFFRAALFLEKLLFHISSESIRRHNSYFLGGAISSEQLPFWRAPVPEQLLLCSS